LRAPFLVETLTPALSDSTELAEVRRSGRGGKSYNALMLRYIPLLLLLIAAAPTTKPLHTNRLAKEKSPYLLQHAHNPVDWFAWGQEAFAKAKKENKPILLSIGYSTCHWCHVMERESFENEATAKLMNEWFVCIKVDREERPDVDRAYMFFVQASTGSGGWPMTVFLTPDLKPFFGGTYFPPEEREGMRGFPTVLSKIHEAWEKNNDKLVDMAEGFTKVLKAELTSEVKVAGPMRLPMLARALAEYKLQFDEERGGFGAAPKFPRPPVFHFLLRYHIRTGDADAKRMTLATLDAMAKGGMHDQLGGGFHRYSTDGRWFLPHFEKMLYDQAQLAGAYLDAYQLTHEEKYAAVARDVLDYVLRDMTGSEGQFYSAEDADSAMDPAKPDEKGEGAFYVWSKEEIDRLAGKDAEPFDFAHGVVAEGNVKVDPRGEFKAKNVLYAAHSLEETAKQFTLPQQEVKAALERAKNGLLKARSSRPRPHLDDKTITAWNGLMISAFARGGIILRDGKYTRAALKAAEFVRTRLYDQQQKVLKRRYRDGQVDVDGFCDDYAFYIQGLLDLYEVTLDVKWLKLALELQTIQDVHFWDEAGGYFASNASDQTLLLRIKESSDNAEPSASSVATQNLLRLAQMSDDKALREKADKTLAHFASRLADHPSAMPQMLSAALFGFSKPRQVIIASKGDTPDRQAMLEEIYREYLPNKIVLGADGGEGQQFLGERIAVIKEVSAIDGKATAYVCENYVCKLPTTDLAELRKMLAPPKQ
jgi:uncharacterized protein YyaL (SSP411 family)